MEKYNVYLLVGESLYPKVMDVCIKRQFMPDERWEFTSQDQPEYHILHWTEVTWIGAAECEIDRILREAEDADYEDEKSAYRIISIGENGLFEIKDNEPGAEFDCDFYPQVNVVIPDNFIPMRNKYMLVSVYEREISTEFFQDFYFAHQKMMEELKKEYDKSDRDDWVQICLSEEFDDGELGFTKTTAYSNLDDDMSCDWKIFAL